MNLNRYLLNLVLVSTRVVRTEEQLSARRHRHAQICLRTATVATVGSRQSLFQHRSRHLLTFRVFVSSTLQLADLFPTYPSQKNSCPTRRSLDSVPRG